MLLNSRVEHDNSAGSTAVEPSVARSGSGRSPTELDSQSVAASQTSVLERYNRSASPRNASASSVRSGAPGRSTSGRSVESEARRVSGRSNTDPALLVPYIAAHCTTFAWTQVQQAMRTVQLDLSEPNLGRRTGGGRSGCGRRKRSWRWRWQCQPRRPRQ